MDRFENIPPEFEAIRDDDESIYWIGQPTLIPFLMTGVPFLIFGIIWGIIDLQFMQFGFSEMGGFFGLFMLLHLFPFYGSILNMVRLLLVYNNTRYAYTNKRLMLRTGFFGIDFKTIDYDKIQNIEVNVNPLERFLHVGTIKIFSGEIAKTKNGHHSVYTKFIAIQEPYEVFRQIKRVSVDIKTDWNFPNQMRPQENPGYRTTYRNK